MNILSRLSFVLFSIIILVAFFYGVNSLEKLSEGQSLMLWSLVPASLTLLTAALQTKGDLAVPVMLGGIFLVILSFGMYKQSGEVADGAFAWLGLMLSGTAIAAKVMDHIPSRASFSRS